MSRWGHIKPSLRAVKWDRIEPSYPGQIRLSRPDVATTVEILADEGKIYLRDSRTSGRTGPWAARSRTG